MTPERIIIHCSDSQNGKNYSIEHITRDHIARGFTTIGYHGVFQPDGQFEQGRPYNVEGAHCQGENYNSIGLCLIGKDKFTRVQMHALKYKLDGIMMAYNIKPWNISCHRDWPSAIAQGKTCPNILGSEIVAWYLTDNLDAIKKYLL